MVVYRAEFSDESFRVRKWKYHYGYGQFKDATAFQPIDCLAEWDVGANTIMFQARHYSSLVNGLRAMGKTKFLLPAGPVAIGHQYWVSKNHRTHSMSSLARPSSRAFAEKIGHYHKVALWKGFASPMNDFTSLHSEVLGSPTYWTANRLAEKLEASGEKVGKAPNVAQDAIEEMISLATMIGDVVLPR